MFKIIFFIIFTFPTISFACSCASLPIDKQLKYASKVYVGVLTSSHIVEKEKGESVWSTSYIEGTIKVKSELKGEISPEEKIKTGFDCGISMTVGATYFIIMDGDNHISYCGGSKRLPQYIANEYISNLKEIMD